MSGDAVRPDSRAVLRRPHPPGLPPRRHRGLFGMGLGLPQLLAAPHEVARHQGRFAHLRLPARRAEHDRHVRPEAGRPGRVPRRVQPDRDQRARRPGVRASAEAWRRQMDQYLADPLVPPPQLGPRAGRPLHAHRVLPAGRVQPDPQPEQPAAEPSGRSSPQKLGPRGSVPAVRRVAEGTSELRVGLPRRRGRAPFGIDADPNAPDFSVPDVLPPLSVAAGPPGQPQGLLEGLDRFQKARRGEGQPARRDGRRVPAEGVRADDLAGSQEGVRHRGRAGEAPRRLRPALARPVLPDGPPARRGRRPVRDHRPLELGHARRQLRRR